jgi:hypothetical protein
MQQQAGSSAQAAQLRHSRQHLQGLNAYERHKWMMADYVNFYGGRLPPPPQPTARSDYEILREQYRCASLPVYGPHLSGCLHVVVILWWHCHSREE